MKARKKGGRLTQWGKTVYEILGFRFSYPKMTQTTTYKIDITTKNYGRGVYPLWSVNDAAARPSGKPPGTSCTGFRRVHGKQTKSVVSTALYD